MLIIGCDFHPGFQQVTIFDNETGEVWERRLSHREEALEFYGSLRGQAMRVGMEACGHYPWFERLLEQLGMELWIGDAARIRAMEDPRGKRIWYVIPVEALGGRLHINLYPFGCRKDGEERFEEYRGAWRLLECE